MGNQNHDTPELRSIGPLITRLIRIYPERATNEGVGLRLELLGCELEGESLLPQTDLSVCRSTVCHKDIKNGIKPVMWSKFELDQITLENLTACCSLIS